LVIFLVLMKIFRTHIIQSFGAAILLAGMVFYFLTPSNQMGDEDAFTNWLKTNLKTSDNAEVINEIQKLSHSTNEIESVIRKASSLVKTHADDFTLPLAPGAQDENDVFQVLLTEWNAFQNSSSGMGKAVIIKQAQPYTVPPVDGISFSTQGLHIQEQWVAQASPFETLYLTPVSANYHISPLSGGTAIGAP